MKIQVTQDHIDRATCGHSNKCAIAEALMDALKCTRVEVNCVIIAKSDDWELFMFTTEPMWDFMADFDNMKGVKPFEFEIPDYLLPVHLRTRPMVTAASVLNH